MARRGNSRELRWQVATLLNMKAPHALIESRGSGCVFWQREGTNSGIYGLPDPSHGGGAWAARCASLVRLDPVQARTETLVVDLTITQEHRSESHRALRRGKQRACTAATHGAYRR